MHMASTMASGWSARRRARTASNDPSLPRLPEPNSPKNPTFGPTAARLGRHAGSYGPPSTDRIRSDTVPASMACRDPFASNRQCGATAWSDRESIRVPMSPWVADKETPNGYPAFHLYDM